MLHKQFAALGIESDAERIAREAKEALKPKKPIEISTPAQPTAIPTPMPSVDVAEAVQDPQSVTAIPVEEAIAEPVTAIPVEKSIAEPVTDIPVEEAIAEPVTDIPVEEAIEKPSSFSSKVPLTFDEALLKGSSVWETYRKTLPDFTPKSSLVRNEKISSELGVNISDPLVQEILKVEKQGLETAYSFYEDFVKQLGGGLVDAAEQVTEVIEDVTGYDPYDFNTVERSDTLSGQFAREGARFGVGFAAAWTPTGFLVKGLATTAKALGMFKTTAPLTKTLIKKVVRIETAAVAGEQLVYDPMENRISDIVENYTTKDNQKVLSNALTEYLQNDPEDSESVARFKLAVESTVISGMASGIFKAAAKLISLRRPVSNIPKFEGKRSPEVEDAASVFMPEGKEIEILRAERRAQRQGAEKLGDSRADNILIEFTKTKRTLETIEGMSNNRLKTLGITESTSTVPEYAAKFGLMPKQIKSSKRGIITFSDVKRAASNRKAIGSVGFDSPTAESLFKANTRLFLSRGRTADDILDYAEAQGDLKARTPNIIEIGSLKVRRGTKLTVKDIKDYLDYLKIEDSAESVLKRSDEFDARVKKDTDIDQLIEETPVIKESFMDKFYRNVVTPYIDYTSIFQRIGTILHQIDYTLFKDLAKVSKDKGKITNLDGIGTVGKTIGVTSQTVEAQIHSLFQGKLLGGNASTLTPLNSAGPSTIPSGAKVLEDIITPLVEKNQLDNFVIYITAVSSHLREAAGRVTHMGTATKGQAGLEKVIKELEDIPGFKDSLEDFASLTDTLLDDAVSSGVLSLKEAKRMKRVHPVYVPLQIFDSTVVKLKHASKGNFDKRLMNPLEAFVRLASKSSRENVTNKLLDALFTGYDNAVSAGGSVAQEALRITRKITVKDETLLKKEMAISLQDKVRQGDIDEELLLGLRSGNTQNSEEAFDRLFQTINSDPKAFEKMLMLIKPLDIITTGSQKNKTLKKYQVVFRDGKPEIYEIFNEELEMALSSLNDSSLKSIENHPLFQASKNINKSIASFITTSPAFAVANVIRDSVSAGFNSSFSAIPFYHTAIGFAIMLKEMRPFNSLRTAANAGGYSQKYIAAGGRISNRVGKIGTDLNQIDATVSSVATRQEGILNTTTGVIADVATIQSGRAKKGLLNSFAYIQRVVSAMESMPRLGEFYLALKAGADIDTAVAASLEVTVNFSRRGANKKLRLINQNVMFLNAGIQGISRLARSFKNQPRTKVVAFMTGLAAFDFYLDRISSEAYLADPGATKYSDIFKDMNYMIPNYTADGTLDKELPFYSIPKSYDIGMLGGVITRGLRSINENSAEPFAGAVGRLLNTMNPFSGRSLMIPTSIKPFADLLFNESWTGSEIVPSFMKTADFPKQMVRAGTGDAALALANSLLMIEQNFFTPQGQEAEGWISPIALDFLANAYLAGSLQYVKGFLDLALRDEEKRGTAAAPITGTSFTTFNPIEFAYQDIKRRFTVSFTQGTENLTVLYELQNRARAAKSAYRSELEQLDYVLLKERSERSETQALADISPLLNAVISSLAGFRSDRNKIQVHKTMSSEEKRYRINKIMQSEQELARRTMRQIESIPRLEVLLATVWGQRKTFNIDGNFW
tara:strand:+ start:1149 stop:5999 length:4851 start_codon:yes stop_codon:yes gene_type:complete